MIKGFGEKDELKHCSSQIDLDYPGREEDETDYRQEEHETMDREQGGDGG